MPDPYIVSEDDMALVHALEIVPRISWALLAPVLGASPQTLERRWRRLRDAGLVWTSALPNARIANDGCLAFVGASCDPAQTETVAQSLADDPEVLSVEVTTGRFDLLFTVATPNVLTMTDCLFGRIGKTPGLTSVHAMLATTVFKNGTQWRLKSLTPSQIRLLGGDSTVSPLKGWRSLSGLDHKLRDSLAEEGRMTFSDLGRRVGTNRNTARRRVDRMLESGVFSIRCDLAASAFGWPVSASFGIDVGPADVATIGHGLASDPHVRLVAAVADRPNVLLTCWLNALGDVPKFESHLMRMFPKIHIVDRYVDLYSTKRMGRLLSKDGRAIGTVVPTELNP